MELFWSDPLLFYQVNLGTYNATNLQLIDPPDNAVLIMDDEEYRDMLLHLSSQPIFIITDDGWLVTDNDFQIYAGRPDALSG